MTEERDIINERTEGINFVRQIDITEPDIVEIVIRADKKVIWVNVNGVCKLRCCRIKELIIEDNSTKI